MSTVKVKVPLSGNSAEVDGWLENLSQYIDANNDIEFVDVYDGSNVIISRFQLDTAGSIAFFGKGQTKADSKAVSLIAGIFHTIPGVHGIDASNTSKSIGIHAKI
jgi:hypothetical protein